MQLCRYAPPPPTPSPLGEARKRNKDRHGKFSLERATETKTQSLMGPVIGHVGTYYEGAQ